MNYEEFKNRLENDLKDTLQGKGFEDVRMDFHDITKANEIYEALTVTPVNSNIGVNVNLDAFFEAYDKGMDYHDVLSRVTEITTNAMDQMPVVDVDKLGDYEHMKGKLSVEVVSKEANQELLANVPYRDMEDMAIIYRFILDEGQNGMQTITVTNDILERMGVDPEQLHADAIANAPEMRPPVIKGMTEILKEMMGEEMFDLLEQTMQPDGTEMLYVATTPDKINGAGILAYPEFMAQAAEQLNGSFFVLPSSRHEVILVKDDGAIEAESLQAMVCQVNATEVSAVDKLTDSVYHYDCDSKVFELASDFNDRMMEKDGIDDDKGSVLKDLGDKKKEVADKPAKDVADKATKTKGGDAI